MTPEQELELLIAAQAKDDAPWVLPQLHVAFSLDQRFSGEDGNAGTFADVVGIDGGEVVSFLPRRRGSVLGYVARSTHGTDTGYIRGCRCDLCVAEHRARGRKWYRERRESQPWHGTVSGYTNRKCRCRECRLTWRSYSRRAWRRLHKQPTTRVQCACGARFKQKRVDQKWCSAQCRQRTWKRNHRAAVGTGLALTSSQGFSE